MHYGICHFIGGRIVKLCKSLFSPGTRGKETHALNLRFARWRSGSPTPLHWGVLKGNGGKIAGEREAGFELSVLLSARLETPSGAAGPWLTGAEAPGRP